MAPDAVTGINTHDDCSAILAVIDLQVAVISRIDLDLDGMGSTEGSASFLCYSPCEEFRSASLGGKLDIKL